MSVCSGAFILGKAGMLDGIPSTTTTVMRSQLAQHFPATKVTNQRFVDAGKVITTAGIDGALYVVSKQLGQQQAGAAAKYMEYDWSPSSNSH